MIKKKILFELPVTSDDFTSDVLLEHFKGKSRLKFDYINQDNKKQTYEIEVIDVFKFVFTSDSSCDQSKIDCCYEQVALIENSPFIDEINANMELNGIKKQKNCHFMVYIPDFGCCEFIANRITNSIR